MFFLRARILDGGSILNRNEVCPNVTGQAQTLDQFAKWRLRVRPVVTVCIRRERDMNCRGGVDGVLSNAE
ncbi:hypothetical protein [Paraburkholderia sp. BL10I2N1]|uniref:hypothetical protein n=1 Tax=Paraburkholderia sp. BL10I2N1 TaxID=1938796 RepID=UPI00106003C2|nr:hypothetical protein [Paraburkholderia sp. BL10I2N1]